MMYLRTWLIATMFGLALVAVSLASKPAPAFGDTQWFGSYMGKTYLTEFDYYPVGYNWGLGGWIYGYCGEQFGERPTTVDPGAIQHCGPISTT